MLIAKVVNYYKLYVLVFVGIEPKTAELLAVLRLTFLALILKSTNELHRRSRRVNLDHLSRKDGR